MLPMNELFIGQFRVDIERGEIVHLQNTITLEPKVLKVFLLLVERPNEVVTHQEILDKVWAGVIVEPNTLQRCIAQLRKAFNDDAKQQNVIATHPRVGYRLVAEVDWKLKNQLNKKKKRLKNTLFGASLFFVTLFAAWLYNNQLTTPLSYTHVTPLTATDTIEYRPVISPNGQYVAFQRNSQNHKANIWVKDLHNNSEYLMTSQETRFHPHAWSPDSKKLAFSLRDNTNSNASANSSAPCDSIEVLTFALAKSSPQSSTPLFTCSQQRIWEVTWLNNDTIAYVVDEKGSRRVDQIHIPSKKITTIYQQKDQYPDLLAYSTTNKKLAISQKNLAQISSIVLLDTTTHKLEYIPVQLADKFLHQGFSGLDWHPKKDILLTAHQQSLYELSLDGSYSEHPISTFQKIFDPVYHPDGFRISATLGIIDMDVKETTWGKDQSPKNSILHRSIVVDRSAKYQPKGEGVALISERSGREQIWYSDGEVLRQISQFTQAEWLESFVWSKQGDLIAVNVSGKLNLLSINGELNGIDHSFKVMNIYQWVTDTKLLISMLKDNKTQLVIFDINNSSIEALYDDPITWAQLNDKNVLYIANHEGKVFSLDKSNNTTLLEIDNLTINKKFFLQDENMIFIDNKRIAWQFTITTNSLTKLSLPEHNIWTLEDIDLQKQRLLYSGFVAGRKEIVMFH